MVKKLASPLELAREDNTASRDRMLWRHPHATVGGSLLVSVSGNDVANTVSKRLNLHSSESASPGEGPRSIPCTSFPTLSLETLERSFS